MAKLSSWGIALHMGLMFGLPNRVALVLLAGGIGAMVVLGPLMWWKRRPTRATGAPGGHARRGALRGAPWWWGIPAVVGTAAVFGLFVPPWATRSPRSSWSTSWSVSSRHDGCAATR
jgi:uncharacterized iron-regulated membrane protein